MYIDRISSEGTYDGSQEGEGLWQQQPASKFSWNQERDYTAGSFLGLYGQQWTPPKSIPRISWQTSFYFAAFAFTDRTKPKWE